MCSLWNLSSRAMGVLLCVLCCQVVSDSVWPYRVYPARFLCPWDYPGKNAGVGCHFLLQGIFPIHGLNSRLLLGRWIHLPLSHLGSPGIPLPRQKSSLYHTVTMSLASLSALTCKIFRNNNRIMWLWNRLKNIIIYLKELLKRLNKMIVLNCKEPYNVTYSWIYFIC